MTQLNLFVWAIPAISAGVLAVSCSDLGDAGTSLSKVERARPDAAASQESRAVVLAVAGLMKTESGAT
ncbi:MAG: hypothetical protein DWQ01_07240 [Planctomycetota bacterium]|nr:MAG: hypothetical protein DWQ01_07240 [Planctomycetota bacterium]